MINSKLKYKVALAVSVVSLSGTLAMASSEALDARVSRVNSIAFRPDQEALAHGHYQYFYTLLDKGTNAPHDAYANQPVGINETQSAANNAKPDDATYSMILKWSGVIEKSPGFLAAHFSTAEFQNATHSNMVFEPTANSNSVFSIKGKSVVPNQSCRIGVYQGDQVATIADPFVRKMLSLDRSLGKPDLVLTETYFNFGKVFFSKTAKESRSVSKVYINHSNPSQSLIVNYTVSQLYAIPPKLFGGSDALRTGGIGFVVDAMDIINKMPANGVSK